MKRLFDLLKLMINMIKSCVKTVNGILPDENGDVKIEVGSGLPSGGEPHQILVTDADGKTVWEERTHYKEIKWDKLTEEQTVEDAEYGSRLGLFLTSEIPAETDILKVVFDSTEYVIDYGESDGMWTRYFGDRTFEKTPFYLCFSGSYTGEWEFRIYCQDAASHTVEVFVQNGVNIVKIPAEYLPKMSASALKLYLKYGDARFYLDNAYETVATKERIIEAYSKGENILIYDEYGTYNNSVLSVSSYNDELRLVTDGTTYIISSEDAEVYTTERTTKSIQWSDISDPLITKTSKWVTILPETEWNGSDEIKANVRWFNVGQTYGVTWDGTYYSVDCANDDMFEPCLGNRSLRSEYNEDTGEPFCISISDGNFDIRTRGSDAHTIEIVTLEKVPEPLDERYIPSTIQRVGDDVILNSSTAGSVKKFKLTVDDSGTLTATEVTS